VGATGTIHAKIARIGEHGLESDPIALAISDGHRLRLLGDEDHRLHLFLRAGGVFKPSDDAVRTMGELLRRSYGSYGRVGFRGPFEVDGPIGDAARRLATQFDLPVFTTDRARELLEATPMEG
jgi:hypothetical protein